ncbi:Holliday junction resolvase RuvX [Anaerosinus massiliensis]|uniref:Holliday junction resolvase RuvX n=1 Tax=Massilibacillus massiliensis TaxID=1806837 RepID=UPI000AD633D3|nr:Holliday junction resolvase RuvX [Massilibacillus massiliensis]
MRILGLDVGDRTIGIAVSDALMFTAQGVETIRRTSLEKDLNRLKELMQQYETNRLLIGLPKNMNGTIGPRGELVQVFGDEVRALIPGTEIIFWDERLSTVAATKSLIAADVSRAKRKKVIDKMAAVFILQGYLDSRA